MLDLDPVARPLLVGERPIPDLLVLLLYAIEAFLLLGESDPRPPAGLLEKKAAPMFVIV